MNENYFGMSYMEIDEVRIINPEIAAHNIATAYVRSVYGETHFPTGDSVDFESVTKYPKIILIICWLDFVFSQRIIFKITIHKSVSFSLRYYSISTPPPSFFLVNFFQLSYN